MPHSYRIVIRADASPEIGGGHVVRSLALAQALCNLNARVFLITCPQTPECVSIQPDLLEAVHFVESGWTNEREHAGAVGQLAGAADIVIIDHYQLGAEFESAARPWAPTVAVIDDAPSRPHDADLVIDPTYGRKAEEYAEAAAGASVLAGSDYALIRDRFSRLREDALRTRQQRKGKLETILVAFGASDVSDVTAQVLRACLTFADLEITVLVPDPDAARTQLRSQQFDLDRVSLIAAWDDVADLMLQADLCIGAAGGMSWERSVMALPAIACPIADNQNEIAALLRKEGAAIVLSKDEPDFEERLAHEIGGLMANPDRVITMSQRAKALCDGRGAQRAAEAIIDLLTSAERES